MSVNAINSVSKSQVKFSASFNLPERKTGMSSETKALIGLSALGATIAGGVLVKKTIDANKISALAKKLLKKPETFDLEAVKDIAVGFAKTGVAVPGDSVLIMGRDMLKELAQTSPKSKWAKLIKSMQMSETGFASVIQKSDNIVVYESLRFFDPEKITYKPLLKTLQEGRYYQFKLKKNG